MDGFDSQRIINPGDLGAIPYGDINHLAGTGIHLLVNPGEYRTLVLSQELATTRFRIGNHLAQTFTADNTTDELSTANHNYKTGDGPRRVSNSGGGLPGGLALATDYWLIVISDGVYKLALSLSDAKKGIAVTITSNGTGTQTIFTELAITAVVGADRQDGRGSGKIAAGERLVMTAPDRITVQLFATDPVLTYHWIP